MPLDLSLSGFRLVLVSPMYGGNVGAVARLAANFDLRDLWIVSPQCDWQGKEAARLAHGPAVEYLRAMRECRSLGEALADCRASVGFTRRSGALRKADTGLAELVSLAKPTALVFGREDGGLSHEDLIQCTHVCHLSSSMVMPSLNLSHAVAVVLARLYENAAATKEQGALMSPDPEAASLGELEALFAHWDQTMQDAGMAHHEPIGNHVRRALQRAQLSSRETAMLRTFLSKTQAGLGVRKNIRVSARDDEGVVG